MNFVSSITLKSLKRSVFFAGEFLEDIKQLVVSIDSCWTLRVRTGQWTEMVQRQHRCLFATLSWAGSWLLSSHISLLSNEQSQEKLQQRAATRNPVAVMFGRNTETWNARRIRWIERARANMLLATFAVARIEKQETESSPHHRCNYKYGKLLLFAHGVYVRVALCVSARLAPISKCVNIFFSERPGNLIGRLSKTNETAGQTFVYTHTNVASSLRERVFSMNERCFRNVRQNIVCTLH